ncbi:MAG TPA: alanyl-tRNA editing protein [Candidatus Faecousia faecavium]|nr:alanyl-tRNA editing protein [Candidatus Faecousia faecavium]
MQTRKLYYEDSHLRRFTAQVLACEENGQNYRVILDATAFYPEGGGQGADTGILGGVRVLDTREAGETVVHFCDGPLAPGSTVEGQIDYDARFLRMQQHSGEHIVSGIINRRFGYHNTGFHMGADCITIDFDGVISPEVLPEIEAEANRAVWQNLPIRCWYPSQEQLPQVNYRTKRALPWPVRIVEIPGFDCCACCGTHVGATGEIGLIKLFSAVHFRGGTRMEMACGKRALEILNTAYQQNKLVSQAFSAQITETGAAAQRMNDLAAAQKYRIIGLEKRIFAGIAESLAGTGDVLLFESDLDGTALRELTDAVAEKSGGRAAVFSGSDETGYGFCLAQPGSDLRQLCKEMTAALSGRGGGKPGFLQGRVQAGKAEIEAFFRTR